MSHFKDARLNPIVLRPAKTDLGFDQSGCNWVKWTSHNQPTFNQGYPKNCIFEGNTQVVMVEIFAINLSRKTEFIALRAFEKTDALYYGFFDFVHLSNSTSIV